MGLSDTWLKSNYKTEQTGIIEKTDRDGLSARVSKKGKVTFQMRFRYAGKAARVDLGTYPLLSLKDARIQILYLRAKLEKGHDPRVVKFIDKTAIQTAHTINSLFSEWYNLFCSQNYKNHTEIKRTFEIYVFPSIGKLPANEVTLHAWLYLLEPIAKKTPSIAKRTLTVSKSMMSWAVKRRLIERNELADINAKTDLNIGQSKTIRTLTDDDIRAVYMGLDNCRMESSNKIMIQLILMFACRLSELRLAKKSDFDLDKGIWTVPAENHKMGGKTGNPIIRPIIDEHKYLIIAAMQLSGSDHLFSNRKGNMVDRGTVGQLPKRIIEWCRRHGHEINTWSVHDLRRTARTHLSRLTTADVAEIMLGHALPGIRGVYDQHDYIDEQALAYKSWWGKLQRILHPEDADNVIGINEKRAG